MKRELEKIFAFLNERNILKEDEKVAFENLLQTADKSLITKSYHNEILKKYKQSKKQLLMNILFFLIGCFLSLISLYFYFNEERIKSDLIGKDIDQINDLCNSKSYAAAREILSHAQSINPIDPRLKNEKLRIDIQDGYEGKKLTAQQTQDLIDRGEQALKEDPDIIWLNNNLTALYKERGDCRKALALYNKNIILSRKLHSVELEVASINNLSVTYLDCGKLDSAALFFKKFKSIADKPLYIKESKKNMDNFLSNYARYYYYMDSVDRCLITLEELFKLKNVDEVNYAASKLLQAEVYQLYDENKVKTVQEEIELSYSEAIAIFKRMDNVRGLAFGISSLGGYYGKMGKCDLATECINQSIVAANRTEIPLTMAYVFGHATETSLSCKNYNRAFLYSQICLKLCRTKRLLNILGQAQTDSSEIIKFVSKRDIPNLIKQSKELGFQYGL